MDDKTMLNDYLVIRRTDLLRKLEGLSEYDARRPLTPTGTNIAGLVKHVASVQLGYLGETFGRPPGAAGRRDRQRPVGPERSDAISC